MQREAIKNLALDRISGHRTVMTYTPPTPDVRAVAQANGVPPPERPRDHTRRHKKRETWKMVGIAVGVALLLVMAIRSKWIKL